MADFALLHTDDPLGLATAGDIVLTDVSETTNKDIVDILSEQAVPIPDSAVSIRAITTLSVSYELRSSDLVLAFGTDVGTNGYRISAVSTNHSAEGYPTVQVTAVKPATGTFADTPGTYTSLTVPGGFGVSSLWGATCTSPTASTCSVSSSQAVAISGTSGAIMTEGLVLYAFRQECSLTGYDAITIPVGAIEKTSDDKGGREAFGTVSKGWTAYLVSA